MQHPQFELDLGVFWREVGRYADWDYQYVGAFTHKHNPKALAGYPDAVFDLSVKAGGGADHSLRKGPILAECWADDNAPKDELRRHYINCCMFVEAAIVATIYQSRGHETFRWPLERHNDSMNREGFASPPEAYVAIP